MSDERSLYKPPSAKEVAAELHELQRADADANRRAFLRDVLADVLGYADAARQDIERRIAAGWAVDPARAVVPVPPRIPEQLRLVEELFAIERALDGVAVAWLDAVARPLATRPHSQFGKKITDAWLAETTGRAIKARDRAQTALVLAIADLGEPECDARVRLPREILHEVATLAKSRAPAHVCSPLRSPYVRDSAPFQNPGVE